MEHTLVNERSVVRGGPLRRFCPWLVESLHVPCPPATFSMHYRRSVALLVVCGACRSDIDYPPSLRTGRQGRPGIAQERVASKGEEVDVGKLATHLQSRWALFSSSPNVPPPLSPPHASRVCPVAVHPSSPLTTRTSARILRLRGEARSFASAGEPTKVHLYGTAAVFPRGFQPTATHMSLRGELPRRRACTSVADTEGAQLPCR